MATTCKPMAKPCQTMATTCQTMATHLLHHASPLHTHIYMYIYIYIYTYVYIYVRLFGSQLGTRYLCVCVCVSVRVCVCKRRTLWQPARHHPQAISGAREAGYLCQSFLYFLPAPVVLGAQRRQMHEDFPHELSHLHTSLSPISRSTLGKARMGRRIRGPSNSQRATATQQQHVQQGRAASLKV